jgi:hypothetical protein
MWMICSDTKFSESIAHSLSTYTVDMCSWRRYGSFYSCSCPIAEMRKSHKTVLSGSCDTWTAAPWSIVSVSKLYKTAL